MRNQPISQQDETRAAIRCGFEVLERITQQNVDVARNTYLNVLNEHSTSKVTSEKSTLELSIRRHVQFALNGNKVAWDAICRFLWGEVIKKSEIELCQ